VEHVKVLNLGRLAGPYLPWPSLPDPEGEGEVHTVLRRQYITYANGHMYYRKYDPAKNTFTEWGAVRDKFVTKASDGLKTLSVVRQKQATPKGPHWSLCFFTRMTPTRLGAESGRSGGTTSA
jgi:hypothetical protein